MCQKQTYAVQQIAAYSITSSAAARSGDGKVFSKIGTRRSAT
jgi:hypothetical protein